jgi:hypothetical protein
MRTTTQLDLVKRIENSLTPEHQAIQTEVLGILANKLRAACAKLEGLLKKETRHDMGSGGTESMQAKPWKYALTKTSLDATISTMQEWQELYDPSWFLIIRISSCSIDMELDQAVSLSSAGSQSAVVTCAARIRDSAKPQPRRRLSVFLPTDGLDYTRAQAILFSRATLLPRVKSNKWVLVDHVPSNDIDPAFTIRGVRELAVKLMNVDPSTFGILKCRGVVKVFGTLGQLDAFDVIFDTPWMGTRLPRSLRGHLTSHTLHTLTERFDLARNIANAVNYVHTLGFVHKNIRPENLISFDTDGPGLGSFYLVGFEHFRTAEGRTFHRGDSAWSRNIYRHPDRQGARPTEDYVMQHDIYSLGVCLLEIGIWGSFLSYDVDEVVPNSEGVLGFTLGDIHNESPSVVKDHLLSLADTHIPSRMGKIYREVVVNCLTCLDEDNHDFGNKAEFEDEDGIVVGVKFIEKVSQLPPSVLTKDIRD